MNKFKKFGADLKRIRVERGLSLREVCKITSYDASNWSKIERGLLSPPSDPEVLKNWARVLEIKGKEAEGFVDSATIAQGIIPSDILSDKNSFKYLPAFFRTMRNKKPTKEELDHLIELIRNA